MKSLNKFKQNVNLKCNKAKSLKLKILNVNDANLKFIHHSNPIHFICTALHAKTNKNMATNHVKSKTIKPYCHKLTIKFQKFKYFTNGNEQRQISNNSKACCIPFPLLACFHPSLYLFIPSMSLVKFKVSRCAAGFPFSAGTQTIRSSLFYRIFNSYICINFPQIFGKYSISLFYKAIKIVRSF